jgi:Icc protein
MRIVQLTDLHIPPAGARTEIGMDTRRNFSEILPRAVALQPDLLVLSGDLCYMSADRPTYHWVREQLEATGLPYAVIAGNHDASAMMAQAFDHSLEGQESYFVRQLGAHTVVFLDSAVATVSDEQLDWLRARLGAIGGPVLLFMHHPPMPMAMPFMDKTWPFRRSADLMAILTGHPAPVYVFCGHYHIERVAYRGNVSVHVTPSLYFQLDPHSERPAVDHTRIALRLIDVDREELITSLQYYDGAGY